MVLKHDAGGYDAFGESDNLKVNVAAAVEDGFAESDDVVGGDDGATKSKGGGIGR